MEKVKASPLARSLASKLNIDLKNIIPSNLSFINKDDVLNYSSFNKPKITPLANKIAKLNNIDIKNIIGSGVKNKITKEDILNVLDKTNISNKEVTTTKEVENKDRIEIIPMNNMRKTIATRMKESYLESPVFALNYDVDVTNLIKLKDSLLEVVKQKIDEKITITDLICMAVARLLATEEYRLLNASIDTSNNTYIVHNYVNLALAVGFDDNLITPVLYDADKLDIYQIVKGYKELVRKTIAMKLTKNEFSNSTFTISNLGMYGVKYFNPIINQPNSAILGVSGSFKQPVVDSQNNIVVRDIMGLSLTIDHRIVDGLLGAKFMKSLKNLLENPILMFI